MSAMNFDELINKLVQQEALIIHCSRPGKSDEATLDFEGAREPRPLYPDDLFQAKKIIGDTQPGLSCSVVWPAHQMAYGNIGIVVRPKTINSIVEISKNDAGSGIDQTTGMTKGGGVPYSRKAVLDTFVEPKHYNEWIVTDAETVGIFVTLGVQLCVPAWSKVEDIEGYDPSMPMAGIPDEVIVPSIIHLDQVLREFSDLPILGYSAGKLVKICSNVDVEAFDLKALYIS